MNGGENTYDDATADDADVVLVVEALLDEGGLPFLLRTQNIDGTLDRLQWPGNKNVRHCFESGQSR